MDNKELNRLHSQLIAKVSRMENNDAYVLGKNPPIIRREQIKKPDNRIPITLAKMTVDDMAGYAGKPGNIKVTYDLTSTDSIEDDDPFIDYMRSMDKYNESDIENAELYYEILEQGEAYEIFWVSDKVNDIGGKLTTEFKIVPGSEIVMVYNDDLKPVLTKAIHFKKSPELETATVYYPLYSEEWTRKNSGQDWSLAEDGRTDYPFTIVPVNPYKGNRRGVSIFDAEKHLIDTIDEVISKSMNEIDRFSSSILLLGGEASKDIIEDLKSNKVVVLDNLSSDVGESNFAPQFLEKNLQGVKDFTNELINKIEQWYRDSTKTVDMSDEAFAGDSTGIALKLKLIPMEFRASQIETYFNQGLKRRLKYYGDVYNTLAPEVNIDDYTTIVKSQRNIPIDEAAIVEMLQKLIGSISKEAFLKALPQSIIADVDKELKAQEEETPDVNIDFSGSEDMDNNL